MYIWYVVPAYNSYPDTAITTLARRFCNPISLQLHLSVYLFIWNYSRVDFATQMTVPGREAPLSTTQPNFSPYYCHSATRKFALPFLRCPHTQNLQSVFYCRSHIAVFLVPSAKFHFCKSICSTNRQPH